MCLPAARRALRTGDMELWRLACRLVAAGEWTIITVCASFLVLAELAWHLFTVTQAGQLPGMAAALEYEIVGILSVDDLANAQVGEHELSDFMRALPQTATGRG